jgi:drug/metabolite transporter (DMT)-like permease
MPIFFLTLTCLLWGLSFPLIKALQLEQATRLPEASSWFLAAWLQVARFGMAAGLLIPLVAKLGRPTRLELRQGLIVGGWGGVGMAIQADSLAYTHASTSAFLTQAYCIFLPLWAAMKHRRPPEPRVVVATVMVIAGSAILAGLRWDDMRIGRGEAGTLIAAFFFTFQILALEDKRYAENRGVNVTFIMCAAIAIMFAPVTFLGASELRDVWVAGSSGKSLFFVFGLALFCSVGAFVLMNTWQRKVTATEAGLIYTMEPVFTAIYVLFLPSMLGTFIGKSYPNETLTLALLAGGGLIVIANVLMQWKGRPHQPAIAPIP